MDRQALLDKFSNEKMHSNQDADMSKIVFETILDFHIEEGILTDKTCSKLGDITCCFMSKIINYKFIYDYVKLLTEHIRDKKIKQIDMSYIESIGGRVETKRHLSYILLANEDELGLNVLKDEYIISLTKRKISHFLDELELLEPYYQYIIYRMVGRYIAMVRG